jgi:hypothetical protein
MFMSFVDDETKKVDIHKPLQEIEQLQQRISDRDVDRVVDSVLNDVLDNDSPEMEQGPSGQEVTNPHWFGLALLGGTSENLLNSESLSLPNFPTQDYMTLSEVAVPMPRLQKLFVTILNQPTRPPCTAMSGQSVFDLMEDLSATDSTTEQVDTRSEPSTTGFVVEAVVEHPLSKEREDGGVKVNVAMEDLEEDEDEVLPPGNWEGITLEDYDMLYRLLHSEYRDFDKCHRAN